MPTLKDVVDHYVNCYKPHHDDELRRYGAFLNAAKPANAIIAEVLLIGAHQTRLHDMPSWHSAAKKAIKALEKAQPWKKNYANFKEIYDDIKNLIGGIKHIGPLTIYDVSLRLAARFKNPSMMPKEVYLSAGPLRAARVLLKNSIANKPCVLNKSAFPPEFSPLSCEDIEDLLCVMGHFDVFSDYNNLGKVPCPATRTPVCILPSRLKGCLYLHDNNQ